MFLLPKDHVNTCKNQLQLSAWQFPHTLCKEIAIQSYDLRDVGDGIFWQPGQATRQRDISWRIRPAKIAGQRDDYDGRDAAPV